MFRKLIKNYFILFCLTTVIAMVAFAGVDTQKVKASCGDGNLDQGGFFMYAPSKNDFVGTVDSWGTRFWYRSADGKPTGIKLSGQTKSWTSSNDDNGQYFVKHWVNNNESNTKRYNNAGSVCQVANRDSYLLDWNASIVPNPSATYPKGYQENNGNGFSAAAGTSGTDYVINGEGRGHNDCNCGGSDWGGTFHSSGTDSFTIKMRRNPTLNVSVSGNGYVQASDTSLINCGNGQTKCSSDYRYPGNSYTLTATPLPGYYLSGWSGDCSGTSTSCTVNTDANDKSVTATFAVSCVPTTCAALGNKDCGTPADGCGRNLNCGTCVSGYTCGGGGVQYKCSPDCIGATCASLGKNCGSGIPNGCGVSLNCGSCASPQTCGGGGTANVCGCTVSSWSPATNTVCSGTSFTQTSNCNTTKAATGTKSCACPSMTLSSSTINLGQTATLSFGEAGQYTECGSMSGNDGFPSWIQDYAPFSFTVKPTTPGTKIYYTGDCNDADGYEVSCYTATLYVNTPVNGVCGSSNGQNFYSIPSTNLCNSGTPTAVIGGRPWRWSCNGSYGGTNASCTANKTVDGICGGRNRTYPVSETTWGAYSICDGGGPLPASPIFPLPGNSTTWSCIGSYGGPSPSCTGIRAKAPTLSLTADSPVYSGGSSTITWTPSDASSCWGSWDGGVWPSNTGGSVTVNPTSDTTYTMNCYNTVSSGSTADMVSKSVTVTIKTDGVCGSTTNGQSFYSAPSANLCNSGTPTAVSGSGPWNWNCNGSGGGTNSPTCNTKLKTDGVCGSASGYTYSVANGGWGGRTICDGGTASPPSPAFPLPGSSTPWDCNGSNGGNNSSCIAYRAPKPTLDLTASSYTVAPGASVDLSWTTANATSCWATGSWTGNKGPASGSETVTLPGSPGSYTYSLECWNDKTDSTGIKSVTITVIPGPTLTFYVLGSLAVVPGASRELYWSAGNASSCWATGSWTGNKSPTLNNSEIVTLPNIPGSYNYYLECWNSVAVSTGIRGVTITVVSNPTLTFSASPTSIYSGDSATLSWNTTGATSCNASAVPYAYKWTGTVASTDGVHSTTVNPNVTKTFYLECKNGANVSTGTQNVTITIKTDGVCGTAKDHTYAIADADWGAYTMCSAGTQSPPVILFPIPGFSTSWWCNGTNGGTDVPCSASRASVPTLTLTAAPTTISAGSSSTLTWATANVGGPNCWAESVPADVNWAGNKSYNNLIPLNQTVTPPIASPVNTYKLECWNTAGDTTGQKSVVVAQACSTSISLSPTTVLTDQSSTLTWTTSNVAAGTCNASNSWSGIQSPSNLVGISVSQSSANTYPYTLTCQNTVGQTCSSTANLTVNSTTTTTTTTTTTLHWWNSWFEVKP